MADGRGATGELRAFRGRFYGCLGRRVDALFELTDAMLTSGTVPSPVHLSLAAVHRRGWSSLYAALWHGAIDEEALREVLAHRMSIDEDGESYGTSSTPWIKAYGRAATRRPVPGGDTITTRAATPPASRSWRGGPTNSSPSSVSPATRG